MQLFHVMFGDYESSMIPTGRLKNKTVTQGEGGGGRGGGGGGACEGKRELTRGLIWQSRA